MNIAALLDGRIDSYIAAIKDVVSWGRVGRRSLCMVLFLAISVGWVTISIRYDLG